MKIDWLSRDWIVGPYFALVLSEKEFHAAMDHCRQPKDGRPRWVTNEQSNATVHHLENDRGETVHVVVLRSHEGRSGIEIAGLLIHEAIHIFQRHCAHIGEHDPSPEFEAYSIQHIAMQLMDSFAKRL